MCAAQLEAYPDVKLGGGGHRVCIRLAFTDTAADFPKIVVAVYTLTSTLRVVVALNFPSDLVLSFCSSLFGGL